MNVLWLASWYPNEVSPLEGDFIQRHARAVSKFADVTVIYVSQHGEEISISKTESEEIYSAGVKELRVCFTFPKTGMKLLNKLLYNRRYYNTYKSLITSHFKKCGLPDMVHVHVPMKAGVIAKWIKKNGAYLMLCLSIQLLMCQAPPIHLKTGLPISAVM